MLSLSDDKQTTFFYDLALKYIYKLYGFLWTLIVLTWLRIYSCFVMRRTLAEDKQADIIETFNTKSRYLDI